MLARTALRGNALVETMITLMVLLPLPAAMVLLGKQLDVKHKSFDALRYSVWERTVWSERGGNGKSGGDIATEALDRSFGDPRTGLLSVESLRSAGVSQNPLWRHHRRPLLRTPSTSAISSRLNADTPPVEVGHVLIPGLAHGTGPVGAAATALQMDDIGLNRHSFVSATISANIEPLLAGENAEPLTQRASGAVLSDVWSPRDEAEFGRRVDRITANELVEGLELPARPIGMQALSKGGPLYGEGQYSWDPQLRPRSNALPSAYVVERAGD